MSVKAKKHLGQHFLTDKKIAKKIADTLISKTYTEVLEIGPGMGVLTKYLLDNTNYTTSVIEIDGESVTYLKEHYKDLATKGNWRIFQENFLKVNLQEIYPKKQFAIIGNFPYNISTQIVFKTLANKEYIPEFAGMFQKEVAERIAEKAGSKKYGILSVLTQAFYKVEYLFTVPPEVFNPPPKVESGVLRLTRKKDYSLPVEEKLFYQVVKTAFNQRRKMLRKSLRSLNISEELRQDVFLTKRPEQLSVEEFIHLTKLIEKEKS